MNHLIQSCQFHLCDRAISIVGEGKGQTFGGTIIQACIIQKCGDGIFMRNGNVPTHIQGAYIQACKRGLAFNAARATVASSYFENPGGKDIVLTKASRVHLVGWSKVRSWQVDHTSEITGEMPER